MLRKPAVAGTFYAGERDSLIRQIEECFTHPLGPGKIPQVAEKGEGKILGLISPHAGYMYSGPVAAWGFKRVIERERPETVIILGPNHRGFGSSVAIMSQGEWETPLGKVQIDNELADKLLKIAPSVIQDDIKAHQREHSLEVQIPFLQYGYNHQFKIVPICLADQSFNTSIILGKAISKLMKEEFSGLLIASTDLTHYQPHSVTKEEDKKILEAILSGSPGELNRLLSSHDFSMCGYGAVMAIMQVVCSQEGVRAKLLKYATSGDITGDYSAVVGYASLVFEK